MLYSIPGHIKIRKLTEKKFSSSTALYPHGVAVLEDHYSERKFLINNTICTFIEKFQTAKDFITANKEIAVEVNVTEDDIRPYTEPFFNHLKKMRFIVESGSYKPVKPKTLLRKNNVLGNYRIEKKLDTTRKTDIYIGKHTASKKTVVIKLLKQANAENIAGFKREYNFLSALKNSSVTPRVFDFIEGKECYYFIQDYVKGIELNDYLDNHPHMRLRSFVTITEAIINGFKIIHDKGIVHGDIHPANIFVTPSKQVKIIDFGMALHQKLEHNEMVKHGGAYFYMPPERINSTTHNKFLKQPDFYSDVYQTGVVLYTMLYNKYPFNGIIWEELAQEIKEKEPIFGDVSSFGFVVPVWLKELIKECIAKNPEQRFATAAQLHKAFKKSIFK
ncbi:MAG TPA: serine/threonine-protein kinase [Parafilimonas sp.]|nr:serine/threonine-protein kinase [Parafilimonas sp.]